MNIEPYSNNTGLPSVSQILNRFIYTGGFKEAHRIRGSALHQAARDTLLGGFPILDRDDWRGYFRSFLQFAPRIKKVILLEKRLISPEKMGYCGQLDFIGVVDLPDIGEQICLADWKTSQSLSKSMAIQLAGYNLLVNEDHAGHGLSGVIQQRVNVLFNKDGGPPKVKIWERGKWDQHDSIFLGALRASLYFGIDKKAPSDEMD